MTSISSSSLFKHLCKFCHSPASRVKKIGRLFVDDRDINQINFDSSKEHYFYLISPNVIGGCLKSRKKDKIKLSYINFSIHDFKSSAFMYRKYPVTFNKIKNKYVNAVLTCQCNKTYWIISAMDNSFYPELNRKSKIKKVI